MIWKKIKLWRKDFRNDGNRDRMRDYTGQANMGKPSRMKRKTIQKKRHAIRLKEKRVLQIDGNTQKETMGEHKHMQNQ